MFKTNRRPRQLSRHRDFRGSRSLADSSTFGVPERGAKGPGELLWPRMIEGSRALPRVLARDGTGTSIMFAHASMAALGTCNGVES